MRPDVPGAGPVARGIGFARASELHRRHLDATRAPSEFALLGRGWTLLPGVFSPAQTPVTELFTGWVPYPRGGTFLEMGCGTGVTAVTAALAGCAVTALDIAAAAVENTRLNAERHGVGGRVDVRQSDLFDAVSPGATFDVIYWNSNFVLPPQGFVAETPLEHAFFDADYAAHRRFLEQAPSHLAPAGRLLLGFSDLGSWPDLHAACRAAGLVAHVVRAQQRRLEVPIEFQLVELRRARAPR